jgi:hypothetical protein
MIFVTSFDHWISSGAKRITVSPGLPGAFAARGDGRAGAGVAGEDKNGAKTLTE